MPYSLCRAYYREEINKNALSITNDCASCGAVVDLSIIYYLITTLCMVDSISSINTSKYIPVVLGAWIVELL